MHTILLIFKYLRRKLAPMFAAMAVMLCTAMVIIVISVMGGFLAMMKASVKNLTSDVIVRGDLSGIPQYDKFIEKLRERPEVSACSPVINAYGLINMSGRNTPVEVQGIDPKSMDEVVGFRSKLNWTSADMVQEFNERYTHLDELPEAERKRFEAKRKQISDADLVDAGMTMTTPPYLGKQPAIIPGVAVGPANYRDEHGNYAFYGSTVGQTSVLTVLPISKRGQPIEPEVKEFVSVNEFKSGRYEIDSNRVYVPFDLLQKMMKLDAHEESDPETGKPTGKTESARCSEIMVRGRADVPLAEIKSVVEACVKEFMAEHPDEPIYLGVITWEEKYGTFIHAVEKEKILLTFLFSLISVVAVAMIAVIFYMIVLEKTRDIGVLRALGVSEWGVMSIFLGYGLAIGLLGATLGLALSVAIVKNINTIQDALEKWFGFKMWDPKIYLFDKIPTDLNPREVTIIFIFAVLSSLVGSFVPAFLAGRLDPVESLRYE